MEFHTLIVNLQEERVSLDVIGQSGAPPILSGHLGHHIPADSDFSLQYFDERMTVEWLGQGTLQIDHIAWESGHKYDIEWTWRNSKKVALKDTFSMRNSHWYGAAQVKKQTWPLEKWCRKLAPYVTGNSYKDEYGGVQERYWLSSKGVAIFVEPEVPLFVGMNTKNDGLLSLVAKYNRPYKDLDGSDLSLKYSIFQSSDVKSVHQMALCSVIPKPVDIPNEALFRDPIWSTWAQYKKDINQDIVLKFAQEILRRGFKAAQVEIDDGWTPSYGDMCFDAVKFPNPKQMVDDLKEMGLETTLWVHPFANLRSRAYSYDPSHWIQSSLPTGGMTSWWNGYGRLLDVTNPAAVAWFTEGLTVLKEQYGFASYKFDAGEISWMPRWPVTHIPLKNPSAYTIKYAEMAYRLDQESRRQEIRVGFRTQQLPVLVRMMDKDSNWSMDNGLQTLIPHALTFSVIGYPFMLPDMVGGNAYSGLPDRELYIRWIEVNALLPSIQFSIVPWQYDEEVVRIALSMMKIREQYTDLMIALAHESTKSGSPIVRPLWWIAPNDAIAQVIDSEFLVGDNLLVAPVLKKGAISREVYLPKGTWRDQRGEIIQGGRWIHEYAAALHELPHFQRETKPSPLVANIDTSEVPEGARERRKDEGDGSSTGAESSEPTEQISNPPESESDADIVEEAREVLELISSDAVVNLNEEASSTQYENDSEC